MASQQCGCCFEVIVGAPVGLCRSCIEAGSWVAAPLCGKCVVRHGLPDNYKRLKDHNFEVQQPPGSNLLKQIGIETTGSDFCSLHPGEPLRFYCRDKACAYAICAQCMVLHRGHVLEDAIGASDALRRSLVARVFLAPCWATPSSEPTPPSAQVLSTADMSTALEGETLASTELLARLSAIAAARRELEASAQAAASRAVAEIDASIAELNARKAALLAHMTKAVASKIAEIDAEADAFVAATERISTLAQAVRAAVGKDFGATQFVGLHSAILAKADSAFAAAAALPQGRLLRPSVDVSLGDLAALRQPVFSTGSSALTVSIPREVADDQLRTMTTDKLAATFDKHLQETAVVRQVVSAIGERAFRRTRANGSGRGAKFIAPLPKEQESLTAFIPNLVKALGVHAGDADIIAKVFRTFQLVALDLGAAAEAARHAAVPAIMVALAGHTKVPRVQEAGLRALQVLVVNDDNEAAAVKDDVILKTLSAMRSHASDPGVSEAGCRLLYILTASDVNEIAAARAGGLQVVLAVITSHAGAPVVVEAACRAIRNLSFNPETKAAAARAGVLPLLVAMLTMHASVPAVVEAACAALRSVTNHAGNHAAGGCAIPAITSALQRACTAAAASSDIAESACWVLSYLAAHVDNQAMAGAALPAVSEALSTHGKSAAVVDAACRALRNIASPANAHLRLAAIPGVLDALRAPATAHAAEATCRVLEYLVQGAPDRQAAAVARGAVTTLEAVVALYHGSTASDAAVAALKSLGSAAEAAVLGSTSATEFKPIAE